jgi:hypothetical protein
MHLICTRTGMFVNPPTYDMVTAYISGYDHAMNGGYLQGFREWLIVRADGGNNLVWPAIVPYIVFPNADDPIAELHASEANEAHAIEMLESLFNEYRSAIQENGLRGIFHAYEKWLVAQSWYNESSPQFLL